MVEKVTVEITSTESKRLSSGYKPVTNKQSPSGNEMSTPHGERSFDNLTGCRIGTTHVK
jgi:hypothetical protein